MSDVHNEQKTSSFFLPQEEVFCVNNTYYLVLSPLIK
jgi:hypothetical protein